MADMRRALVVVDVQRDFCEGGALAVAGGAAVAAGISRLLAGADHQAIVATRDHHIDPGPHFSPTPDYVDSWPPHCRAGTTGEEFHPALDLSRIQSVFSKGQFSSGYSGFDGTADDGTRLAPWLRERGIDAVDVVGIATDHCVRATALDGAREGFAVRVLLDHTAAVAAPTLDTALAQMRDAGVRLVGHVASPE